MSPKKDPAAVAAAEALFLEHLPLIEKVIADSARRSNFLPQDAEDFGSWVKLRLIERDYRVLRAHKGLSRVSTFLTTVIKNLTRDYQDHLWGKYRPSAQAKKLGSTAVALERLLVRDGFELEEAIRILTTRLQVGVTEEELQEHAAALKPRERRRFVDAEVLEIQGVEEDQEARAAAEVHEETQARLQQIVEIALTKLSAQDFLILQLFYGEGLPISRIAKTLHLEQRPLYRRHQRCLGQLKEALVEAGVGWPEVQGLLSWEDRNVRLSLLEGGPPGTGPLAKSGTRPSQDIDEFQSEEGTR